MNVVLLRADEPTEVILRELMKGCDTAIQFDCASARVNFIVHGWFVFPGGSLKEHIDVEQPT